MKNRHKLGVLLTALPLWLIIFSHQVLSQEKMGIGIIPFSYSEKSDPELVAICQDIVTNAFINSNRFRILEREMINEIYGELDRQKDETFILSKDFIEQGKLQGARYLLLGKLNRIVVEESISTSATNAFSKMYKAFANISLKIVDAQTTLVMGSINFDTDRGMFSLKKSNSGSTPTEAIMGLNSIINDNAVEFIAEYLPLKIGVGKLISEKKGRVREVYILAGEGDGIKIGTMVKIMRVTMEDPGSGEIIRIETEIATGKITEERGAKLTVMQVRKGGAELMKSLSNSEELICKTMN